MRQMPIGELWKGQPGNVPEDNFCSASRCGSSIFAKRGSFGGKILPMKHKAKSSEQLKHLWQGSYLSSLKAQEFSVLKYAFSHVERKKQHIAIQSVWNIFV